jgi:hypothetical protein
VFSRPRSVLFWLVLIILLYVVATAPTELAHAVLALAHATTQFFDSLDILVDTLTSA